MHLERVALEAVDGRGRRRGASRPDDGRVLLVGITVDGFVDRHHAGSRTGQDRADGSRVSKHRRRADGDRAHVERGYRGCAARSAARSGARSTSAGASGTGPPGPPPPAPPTPAPTPLPPPAVPEPPPPPANPPPPPCTYTVEHVRFADVVATAVTERDRRDDASRLHVDIPVRSRVASRSMAR